MFLFSVTNFQLLILFSFLKLFFSVVVNVYLLRSSVWDSASCTSVGLCYCPQLCLPWYCCVVVISTSLLANNPEHGVHALPSECRLPWSLLLTFARFLIRLFAGFVSLGSELWELICSRYNSCGLGLCSFCIPSFQLLKISAQQFCLLHFYLMVVLWMLYLRPLPCALDLDSFLLSVLWCHMVSHSMLKSITYLELILYRENHVAFSSAYAWPIGSALTWPSIIQLLWHWSESNSHLMFCSSDLCVYLANNTRSSYTNCTVHSTVR